MVGGLGRYIVHPHPALLDGDTHLFMVRGIRRMAHGKARASHGGAQWPGPHLERTSGILLNGKQDLPIEQRHFTASRVIAHFEPGGAIEPQPAAIVQLHLGLLAVRGAAGFYHQRLCQPMAPGPRTHGTHQHGARRNRQHRPQSAGCCDARALNVGRDAHGVAGLDKVEN